jgi:hypothetical protein
MKKPPLPQQTILGLVRSLAIVCNSAFYDAFDSFAIAFVLTMMIDSWTVGVISSNAAMPRARSRPGLLRFLPLSLVMACRPGCRRSAAAFTGFLSAKHCGTASQPPSRAFWAALHAP